MLNIFCILKYCTHILIFFELSGIYLSLIKSQCLECDYLLVDNIPLCSSRPAPNLIWCSHHPISFPYKIYYITNLLAPSQIFLVANSKWLQVISEDVAVKNSEGKVIESQLLPLADASIRLRNYHVKAYLGNIPTATPKFWLAFPVSVPPFGFSTYIISTSRRAGLFI